MPRETQLSDVGHLSVPALANSALLVESYLDMEFLSDWLTEKLRDRRKVYLDELVARGAIESYTFV